MSATQIVAVLAASGVAAMYLWPVVQWLFAGKESPVLLTHIRNVIAVRDEYRTPEVTAACNALMEALLGIKP
jgi:hypothetical protein